MLMEALPGGKGPLVFCGVVSTVNPIQLTTLYNLPQNPYNIFLSEQASALSDPSDDHHRLTSRTTVFLPLPSELIHGVFNDITTRGTELEVSIKSGIMVGINLNVNISGASVGRNMRFTPLSINC
jgi:hypothetical protein